MLRILTATSLLALSAAPGLAQTTMPTSGQPTEHGSTHSAMPAAPATPATPAMPAMPRSGDQATVPATPATPATPAMPMADATEPMTPTAPVESAEPRAVTVQKLVDAEFPTYDANKNGNLESAEFSNWVLALYDASGDARAPKDAVAKAKWSKAAFATADADKDKIVTKAEMNTFLVG